MTGLGNTIAMSIQKVVMVKWQNKHHDTYASIK